MLAAAETRCAQPPYVLGEAVVAGRSEVASTIWSSSRARPRRSSSSSIIGSAEYRPHHLVGKARRAHARLHDRDGLHVCSHRQGSMQIARSAQLSSSGGGRGPRRCRASISLKLRDRIHADHDALRSRIVAQAKASASLQRRFALVRAPGQPAIQRRLPAGEERRPPRRAASAADPAETPSAGGRARLADELRKPARLDQPPIEHIAGRLHDVGLPRRATAHPVPRVVDRNPGRPRSRSRALSKASAPEQRGAVRAAKIGGSVQQQARRAARRRSRRNEPAPVPRPNRPRRCHRRAVPAAW